MIVFYANKVKEHMTESFFGLVSHCYYDMIFSIGCFFRPFRNHLTLTFRVALKKRCIKSMVHEVRSKRPPFTKLLICFPSSLYKSYKCSLVGLKERGSFFFLNNSSLLCSCFWSFLYPDISSSLEKTIK